jgi:hypothetical protein
MNLLTAAQREKLRNIVMPQHLQYRNNQHEMEDSDDSDEDELGTYKTTNTMTNFADKA